MNKITVLQIADEDFLKENPNTRKYMERVKFLTNSFYSDEVFIEYKLIDWKKYIDEPGNGIHIPSDKREGKDIPILCDMIRYQFMANQSSNGYCTIYIDSDIEILDDDFLCKLVQMLKYNTDKLIVGGEPYGSIVRPINSIMISQVGSYSILYDMISSLNEYYNGNQSREDIWGSRIFDDIKMNDLTILNSTLFFPEPYTKDGNHSLTNKTDDTLGWHHFGYPKPDPIYE